MTSKRNSNNFVKCPNRASRGLFRILKRSARKKKSHPGAKLLRTHPPFRIPPLFDQRRSVVGMKRCKRTIFLCNLPCGWVRNQKWGQGTHKAHPEYGYACIYVICILQSTAIHELIVILSDHQLNFTCEKVSWVHSRLFITKSRQILMKCKKNLLIFLT